MFVMPGNVLAESLVIPPTQLRNCNRLHVLHRSRQRSACLLPWVGNRSIRSPASRYQLLQDKLSYLGGCIQLPRLFTVFTQWTHEHK